MATQQSSLAVPSVLFLLEAQAYGLPLGAVERVLPMVEVAPLPSAPEVVLGLLNYHGRVLPVINLRARLGLPPRAPEVADRLLIVTTRSRVLALPADSVIGIRDVAPGGICDAAVIHPALRHVAGVAAADDGLIIIQDLEALLSEAEEQELDQALTEADE